MGRTRRSEKTDFDEGRNGGKKRGHARNIPGVGMRTLNSYQLDDVELDDNIAIYLNNTRLHKNIT